MRGVLAGVAFAVLPVSLAAKSLEYDGTFSGSAAQGQATYESVSTDLISTIDYRALGPAEATGIVGFGVGLVSTYVPVDAPAAWTDFTGQSFDGLGLVGLQVTKGLPFGLDVGAFYTAIPETDVRVYGGELRYAILEGSTTSPAVALRGSYVTVDGISTFDAESTSVDISLSKGLTFITPYVGAGYVMGETSDPDGGGALRPVEVEDTKAFLGARITLGLLEVTPEVGQIGDRTVYSLRLGFSLSL